MKNQTCEFEKAIIKESARGFENQRLALHVKECGGCREALKVASFMQNLAAATTPKRNLPAAGFILWKSKIIEKQRAGNRAAQPIVWTQIAAVILALITTVWIAFNYRSKFETVLGNFSASFELIAVPFLIAFVCAAFICFVIGFKWHETSGKNN